MLTGIDVIYINHDGLRLDT